MHRNILNIVLNKTKLYEIKFISKLLVRLFKVDLIPDFLLHNASCSDA